MDSKTDNHAEWDMPARKKEHRQRDLLCLGGREEQGLPFNREVANDVVHILGKLGVHDPVCFIQHWKSEKQKKVKMFESFQEKTPSFDKIYQIILSYAVRHIT